MDCLEGRLKACNKRVAELLASDYLNPDTMKYYDNKDGVFASFNMDNNGFKNFHIRSSYLKGIREEKEHFLDKLKTVNVEDIIGYDIVLKPGKNSWVKIDQPKRNKETGMAYCTISLEIPKSYEEVYQIEKLQELNGLDDILLPKNFKEDKKSLEELEKLRKLKIQKYFDKHPHLNRAYIRTKNGNKILYVRTSDGIIRGGDQLKLNFDAPISEQDISYEEKLEIIQRNGWDDSYRNIKLEYLEEMQSIKQQAIANGTFLKALNGKKSNLDERQWLQVRTKNFINWFGDWTKITFDKDGKVLNIPDDVSKVVDENGEPLVVYHTTHPRNNPSFTTFDIYKEGKRSFIYTTDNIKMSESYAPNESRRKSTGEVVKKWNKEKAEIQINKDNKSIQSLKEFIERYNKANNWKEYFNDESIDEADFEDFSKQRAWQIKEAENGIKNLEAEIDFLYDLLAHPEKMEYTKALFVNIRNPFIVNAEGNWWNELNIHNGTEGVKQAKYMDSKKRYKEEVTNEYIIQHYGQYVFDAIFEYDIADIDDYLTEEDYKKIEEVVNKKYPENYTFNSTRTIESSIMEDNSYDGMIVKNVKDYGPGAIYVGDNGDVFAAKEPNQIKSATKNNGDFSEQDNILNAPIEDSEMLPPMEEDLPPYIGLEDYETIPEIPDIAPDEEVELLQPFENYRDTYVNTDVENDTPEFEEDDFDLSMSFEEWVENKGITIKPEDLLSNRKHNEILEQLINTIVKTKKTRIRKISERINSLKKLGKSTEQRLRLQSELKNLQKEIEELEKRRGKFITKTVEQTIINEINELEKAVTPKVDSDGNPILDNSGNVIYEVPIDADLITIEQFENRLNNLCIFLTGRDINGKLVTTFNNIEFDTNLKNDEIFESYIKKLDDIQRKYDKRRVELILDYAKSDIAKKQFKSEKKRKEFEEVALDFLQHPEKTIDEIFKGLLPKAVLKIADAEQGLGIFGAILKTYFYEEQRVFERQVKSLFDEIKQLEKNIKQKLKQYTSDIFFKRDELGNRTNRLINLFTDSWKNFYYSTITNQNNYRYVVSADFSNKKKQDAFYTFKNQILENAEILQIGELQEIYDLVAEYDSNNNTKFLSTFFPNGIQKGNTQYEYQKYNSKDSIHFSRDVIEKAKQQVLSYMDTLVIEDKKDDVKFIINDGRNPFYFAENFATSHEYNKDLNQLWSIDYVTLLPKKEQYYDKNFVNNISNNEDLQKLWGKLSEIIIDNINTALIESGSNIASDEIPIDLNIVKSEIFKTQTFFKRLGIRWENSHWFIEKFYTSNYAKSKNESNIKTEIGTHLLNGNTFLRKLRNSLKNYDLKQLEIVLNEKGINYKSWSEYLKEFNFSEDNLNSKNEKYYQRLQQRYKGYLASLIASQDVLKSSSLNVVENIGKFSEAVIMMQARSKTKIFADAILDFLKKNQRKDITNDQNYYDSMNIWSQRNIYGNKQVSESYAARKAWRGKGRNTKTTENKISKQYTIPTLPQSFHYDGTNYDISITLKNENDEPVKSYEKAKILFQSNINSILVNEEPETITVNGKTYKVSVSYFKEGKSKIIKREEYLSAYQNKLTQDEESEKLYLTWRSVNDGLMSLLAGKSLMINPESGIKNRWEGEFTNIRLAAQGLFTYGMRELYAAKRFLNVVLLSKSKMGGAKVAEFITPEHYAQLKIYELFTKQMSLYQDHTNLDLVDDEKYKLTAWSIDFPETHNQGENILSTLIHKNIKVKDINGKEFPLFDTEAGKYGKFTIFDENEAVKNNRLKLKSEFDTEENRILWENWIVYKDNYDSLQLIHDCAINVTRAQGNYEKGDVAGTQSVWYLRDLWQFKKWFFSHLKQRYNDTTIDYRAGTLNNKGLYDILMENPKALVSFMIVDTLISFGTAPKTLIKDFQLRHFYLAPIQFVLNILEVGAQIGVPLYLTVKYFKNRSGLNEIMSAKEQEIDSFFPILFEALGRVFTTAANQASLKIDQYSPLEANKPVVDFTEDLYNKTIYDKYKDNEDLFKKRRMLSGAAQQLANGMYLWGLVWCVNMALNILIDHLWSDCDENDPDCAQKKETKLKAKEKSLFFMINLLHNLQDDSRKFHNPFVLFDNMGTASLVEQLKRLGKIWTKMKSEKADTSDKIVYLGKNFPQPFIPNQLMSPISYGVASLFDDEYRDNFFGLVEFPFQDKQIYDRKSFDYYLLDKETRVKTNYDAYKANIDVFTKDYINNLKKEDEAKGINDNDYEKEKKWFRKEFKTKVFGCSNQNEVLATFMNEEDYQEWLEYNSYRAQYYAKYKKYPSEDEIPGRILNKKPQK